jgi:hypothetical protein
MSAKLRLFHPFNNLADYMIPFYAFLMLLPISYFRKVAGYYCYDQGAMRCPAYPLLAAGSLLKDGA